MARQQASGVTHPANRARPKRQCGYLYESPLLVLASVFLSGLLFPFLPHPWDKVVLALPAVAFIGFLIYGWRRRR